MNLDELPVVAYGWENTMLGKSGLMMVQLTPGVYPELPTKLVRLDDVRAALSRSAPAAPAEALTDARAYELGQKHHCSSAAIQAIARDLAPTPAEPAKTEAMRRALKMAIRQNSHDMLMTGEELRECEAALTAPVTPLRCDGCGKTIAEHDRLLHCPTPEAEPARTSADQALELYVHQAEEIREILDAKAPHTAGNLQNRIRQLLEAEPAQQDTDWREPHPPSRRCMCPSCIPSFDDRFTPPAEKQADACEICQGTRGGVPGNENLIDGKRVCDYCHSDMVRAQKQAAPTADQIARHTLRAGDCPPDSKVMLVSSIKRLQAKQEAPTWTPDQVQQVEKEAESMLGKLQASPQAAPSGEGEA